MKHAVKHIHFVGVGLAGGGAPASSTRRKPEPHVIRKSKP